MTTVEDRLACIDLLSTYASGVDHKDWDLWRSSFGERVVWDFSALSGKPAAEVVVEDLISSLQPAFTEFVATHHAISNHRVTVQGDRANIQAHVRADHWVDAELTAPNTNLWTVVGFYDDDAVRTRDGWKLVRVRLDVAYIEGRSAWDVASRAGGRRTTQ